MMLPYSAYDTWIVKSLLLILLFLLLLVPSCIYIYYYQKYRYVLPAQPEAASLYALIIYYSVITFILLFATTYSYTCEPLYVYMSPFLGADAAPVFEILQWAALVCFLSSAFFVLFGIEIQFVRLDMLLIICIYIFASLLLFYVDDFVLLYLVIELQGLCAYIMASAYKDNLISVEAGLKYFILGSLASCFILFGMVLLYGFAGTLNFLDLQLLCFENNAGWFYFFSVCFVFIFSGLFFKLGLFPFHVWVPDVYAGAPLFITAIFAVVPKAPLVFLLVNLISSFTYLNGNSFFVSFNTFCLLTGALSAFIGVVGAFYQTILARLLAYSSIANMGYILCALFTGTVLSYYSVLFFVVIYIFLMLLFFLLIFLFFSRKGTFIYYIFDLQQLEDILSKYLFSSVLFSLAGIPPLAGFFGKILLFMSLMHCDMFYLLFIISLLSTVSAFYYIRLVRLLFFDTNNFGWFFIRSGFLYSFSTVLFTFFNIFFLGVLDFLFVSVFIGFVV